ncbi:TonB-dependent receptor [Candidatus Albibeggiatoa sp. nov. NOAA]|uniref:TonB-dependent receptor plug domain-containing protein n=1 Tax=Candidatus Albibeggiatoa sp. nov. NOAA TaxID=3162724 RepID=UPI003302697E|nr:TonB-dependent receptor [Thiotrichaceae bacterium]
MRSRLSQSIIQVIKPCMILFSLSINAGESKELLEAEISQLLQLSLMELLEVSVTTASKMEESIKDTPVATLVITKRQIQDRGYRHLLDVMQDLPGFDIQKYNHQVEYHSVAMHGHVGSHKFLILQDGVRIDSPTGEAIAIADNFPILHAKQIEVVYGPAAALYGADAFGGVINIITDPYPENQTLHLSFGTDDYRRYGFQAGGELTDKLSFNLSGQLQKHDYSDLFNDYNHIYQLDGLVTLGQNTYQTAQERNGFYAKDESKHLFARVDYDDWLTLGFNQSFLRNPSTTGSKPNSSAYGEDEVWNTEINSVFARFKHGWTDQLQTETLLHYADYEIAPTSRFKNIYVDYLDSYIYARGEKYSVEQQFSYQLSDQHQFIAGLSYEKFYSIPKTTDLPQPYDKTKAPTEQNLYHWGSDNSLPIDIYELRYHNTAYYFQWQAAWRDNLSSTIGLRYDQSSRYSSTLNPRLGWVYQPDDKTVLKLFYGEAFRSPSPTDTHEVFGIFSGSQNEQDEYVSFFFRTPHEELEPEKVRTLQFNAIHSLKDNLQLSLNAYYTTIDDRILPIAETEPTQFISGGQILSSTRNDNFGSAKQYGADVSVLYQAELTDSWDADIWAHYSYIDGYNQQQGDESKQPLRLVSEHKLKLGATFRYQNRYVITPKLYFIGQANNDAVDDINNTTSGYAIMDLHLGATLAENWSISANIYNIFNRRHYHAGLNTLTNLASNVQPLRSVILSLHYQF